MAPRPIRADHVRRRESAREDTGKFGAQTHSAPENPDTGPFAYPDGSTSYYLAGEEVSMHEFRVAMLQAGFTHAIIPTSASAGVAHPGPILVVAGDDSDPDGKPAETVELMTDSWELGDAVSMLAQAGYRPVGGFFPWEGALETEVAPVEQWPPGQQPAA